MFQALMGTIKVGLQDWLGGFVVNWITSLFNGLIGGIFPGN
jgi:hypothetical protein